MSKNSSSERIEPLIWSKSKVQYILYLRHLFAYRFFRKYCNSMSICLDYGCGDGYGAFFLSGFVKKIYGVDVNLQVINKARVKYKKNNIFFKEIIGEKLPFEDNFFDSVLSCQVIEHLEKPIDYLTEAKRTIKEGGLFFVSTPNKLTRLNIGKKPWNRFHVKEYSSEELKELLAKLFRQVEIYGVFGNDEIMDIEQKRINKRKIFQRIDLFNIRGLFSELVEYKVLNWLQKFGSILNRKKPETISNYSINNFKVSQVNVSRSLDLVAVCKK